MPDRARPAGRPTRPAGPLDPTAGPTTMPATEETYRSQPTLHIVFAISLDRDDAGDRLDDHGRPPPPLEGGPARVPRGRGREARGAEKQKLEEQKREVPGPDRRDRRQDRGGRAEARARTPTQIRQIENELKKLGGRYERLDTADAVQEGRARQPAQPLRRHDRPRRGPRGRGIYLNDASSPSRAATAQDSRAGVRGRPRPRLKRPKAEKEELLGQRRRRSRRSRRR